MIAKNAGGSMNTREVIAARRSIRRFEDRPIAPEALEAILMAGIQAPSAKNRQPWRLVVVQGERRAEMLAAMRAGIARSQAQGENTGSAEHTARAMEQAGATVFVFNPDGLAPWLAHSIEQNFRELMDVQSIGAAIQNMILAAEDLGLGSLWIGDVLYAYEELTAWLGESGVMVAAISFGHPAESPAARPRKAYDEVVRWR
jgi:nitroreductase